MGRMYTATFTAVAVSAAQDFFELLVNSANVVVIHRIVLSQESDAGDPESEQLRVDIKRFTGSPTSGSGGSTVTPRPLDAGNAASLATVEANNTTVCSGGTSVILHSEAFNVMAGFDYHPTPECRPTFGPSTRCVVSISSGPLDALTMSGTIYFEEIG